MAFRPLEPRHRLYARIACAALFLIAAVLLIQLLRAPVGPASVLMAAGFALSAGSAMLLLFRLWALRELDYWIDRDAVRVFWAGDEIVIPLGEIQKVEQPENGGERRSSWWRWPAVWVRPPRSGQTERVALATAGPEQCLAIVTAGRTYLVSPTDPHAFIAAWLDRRDLGPARVLRPAIHRAALRRHWFWRDRTAQVLLAGGLALGLLLAAYLVWRFPGLPLDLPLHFDPAGIPDRIGPRRAIFLLPGITWLIWFSNAVAGVVLYERQRLPAYLLWGGALVLQIAGLLVARSLLALAV